MGTGQMDISSPEKLIIANRRRRIVEIRRDGSSLESIADTIRSEFELPNNHGIRSTRHRTGEDFSY